MEFLNIIGSISIKPKWSSISAGKLKAGAPISATGTVANSAAAIGLLAHDAQKGDSEVNVVYAGLIDINEVKRSYGNLNDNCIAALKGITFINASGSAIVPSGLPAVSSADNGKVLTVANGAWGAQTPSGGGAVWYYAQGYAYPLHDINYNQVTSQAFINTLAHSDVNVLCNGIIFFFRAGTEAYEFENYSPAGATTLVYYDSGAYPTSGYVVAGAGYDSYIDANDTYAFSFLSISTAVIPDDGGGAVGDGDIGVEP